MTLNLQKPISPSELTCQAAGLKPVGTVEARSPGVCAMCGAQHEKGELVVDFEPLVTFTDWSALRYAGSPVICRFCKAMWNREFTQTHIKSVICSEGVFPAASNDHLAYWILNPPEGPWLFLQGDQKVQHVVWRAPVNRSKDLFHVRAGESVLSIRRQRVVDGAAAAKELAAIATAIRTVKKSTPLKSPFVSLSRDLDALSQGSLRRELLTHAKTDAKTAELVQFILSMTAGELWGLTSVMYATNPHKPQPKQISEQPA